MYLNEMKIGQKAIVKKLYANQNIKRRLIDIGLVEKTLVKCVLKNPFNDPKAYLIRGSLVAIRDSDSKDIEVELI